MNWDEIKHFTEDEMKCKHCGDCNMDFEFMLKLDMLRERIGTPVHVTSGYRCPAHNASVSETGNNGPHTTGKAADIQVTGDKWRDLLELVVPLFPGIGVNLKGDQKARFLHVDDLTRRVWSY